MCCGWWFLEFSFSNDSFCYVQIGFLSFVLLFVFNSSIKLVNVLKI
jgi:hypothetical protein